MAELVAGAFLSSSFQVIFERSLDYLGGKKLDEMKKELDIKLNPINHVLEEAEIKQYKNTHVKKWLDELKHVVYEAEQIFDEIDTDAILKKMKAESKPVTTKVLGFFSSLTTSPYEYRINELLEKLELLATQTKRLGLEDGPCAGKDGLVSWKPSKRTETTALVGESTIYGRDVHKEELIKLLLEGNDSGNEVPIISIVGLGGIGKTTLAKLVYNDKKIKEHFELEAWVYVSESFDVVGLTKAILESFKFSADGKNLNLLQQELQHKLTAKKYLLVLDDIWNGNKESWEQLLLPFNHGSSGSKIIVTTREKEVADVLNSTLFDLKQLDNSDCWSLFVTHAFHGNNVLDYPNLESIGKKIVNKCGGLPLAVKTLGNLLQRKFSQDVWLKILETDMWYASEVDDEINPVLILSYHNLSSNLKRCFAFCSIFPKGYQFQKDQLIKLWMAEGLLTKCCGRDKTEEELGNKFFDDLESISFFQQSLDFEDNKCFVMHDLVNDLAKSESREFFLQVKGDKVQDISERARHIWCSLDLKDDARISKQICKIKGLRGLLVERRGFDSERIMISINLQRDIFSKLKYLRLLSFCGCQLTEVADKIGNLKLLHYLDLTRTKIKSLPDSICELYNLETLILEKCSKLTELPLKFYKLVCLRHLYLEGTYIKKMPKMIGRLNHLQTLSHFVVGEDSGSDIKELDNLNLHGKLCISGLEHVIDPADAAKANMKDKKHLEELNMNYSDNFKFNNKGGGLDVLEALQPNSNLKRLTIEYYNGNCFPNWLRDCHLVSLKLKSCELCSHFPPLGQLPCLKELSISHCYGIKIIGEEFYDNNSTIHPLKVLYITNCPELKRVPPQHLPFLQKLTISDCYKLEECLCLEGSPSLEELYISHCSKLKRAPLPQHLPSLQKLEIVHCEMMEASIPKGDSIIELHLLYCDRILVNGLSSGLKRFTLYGNQYTEFSEEQTLLNCTTILEELSFVKRPL